MLSLAPGQDNNAEYAAMCQYNIQLRCWLPDTRDVLIGAIPQIVQSCPQEQKNDPDCKISMHVYLARGQAHDANNHSIGSLIH